MKTSFLLVSDGLVWYGRAGRRVRGQTLGDRHCAAGTDCRVEGRPSPPPPPSPALPLPRSDTRIWPRTDWQLIYTECVRGSEWTHCHCLQHFSLVWFHKGGVLLLLGWFFFLGGVRGYKVSTRCLFHHSVLLLMLHLFVFFNLIRPHARAVEILCAQHFMNVYHFLPTHAKQNVRYQVVFFCHLFHNLPKRKSPLWRADRPPSLLLLPLMKSIGNALLIMKALSTHQWSLI